MSTPSLYESTPSVSESTPSIYLASDIDPPPKTIFWKLKEWIEWAMKLKKVKLKEWTLKLKEWNQTIKERNKNSYLLIEKVIA